MVYLGTVCIKVWTLIDLLIKVIEKPTRKTTDSTQLKYFPLFMSVSAEELLIIQFIDLGLFLTFFFIVYDDVNDCNDSGGGKIMNYIWKIRV